MTDSESGIAEIDAAIEAHVIWIARFQTWLQGINREAFVPEVIRDDTACSFGKWLYASSNRIPDRRLYEDIMVKHRAFHDSAGDLAKQTKQSLDTTAFQTEFVRLREQSKQLLNLLEDAKTAIQRAGNSP